MKGNLIHFSGLSKDARSEEGAQFYRSGFSNGCIQRTMLWISDLHSYCKSLIARSSEFSEIAYFRLSEAICNKNNYPIFISFILLVSCCAGERLYFKKSIDEMETSLQFVLVQLMLIGSCILITVITVYKLLATNEIS